MSPKTGRPKSATPKEIEVKARIDSTLNSKLAMYCAMNRITRSEAVRRAISLLLSRDKCKDKG